MADKPVMRLTKVRIDLDEHRDTYRGEITIGKTFGARDITFSIDHVISQKIIDLSLCRIKDAIEDLRNDVKSMEQTNG